MRPTYKVVWFIVNVLIVLGFIGIAWSEHTKDASKLYLDIKLIRRINLGKCEFVSPVVAKCPGTEVTLDGVTLTKPADQATDKVNRSQVVSEP